MEHDLQVALYMVTGNTIILAQDTKLPGRADAQKVQIFAIVATSRQHKIIKEQHNSAIAQLPEISHLQSAAYTKTIKITSEISHILFSCLYDDCRLRNCNRKIEIPSSSPLVADENFKRDATPLQVLMQVQILRRQNFDGRRSFSLCDTFVCPHQLVSES